MGRGASVLDRRGDEMLTQSKSQIPISPQSQTAPPSEHGTDPVHCSESGTNDGSD